MICLRFPPYTQIFTIYKRIYAITHGKQCEQGLSPQIPGPFCSGWPLLADGPHKGLLSLALADFEQLLELWSTNNQGAMLFCS